MKITLIVGLLFCWIVSVAAKEYPLPSGWDDINAKALARTSGAPNSVPALPTTPPQTKGSISPLSDDPHSVDVLLGITCRGSGRCVSCSTDVAFLQTITNQIGDDETWKDGQLIACALCQHCPTCPGADENGLCVFVQYMKPDAFISGRQIKQALKGLRDHGCDRCGSIPLHPGNNVKEGELTVNFVFEGCGERIC